MCGIFGFVGPSAIDNSQIWSLARHALQRGQDSSGFASLLPNGTLQVTRADTSIDSLLKLIPGVNSNLVFGHSRLITNGMTDNQPVVRGDVVLLHNGIVVNSVAAWEKIGEFPELEIDTEVLAAISELHLKDSGTLAGVSSKIFETCKGSMSCLIVSAKTSEMVLFSNTGSLYIASLGEAKVFSSEQYPLKQIGAQHIEQIFSEVLLETGDIIGLTVSDHRKTRANFVPRFSFNASEYATLEHGEPELSRCSKCILPSTMPYIDFDSEGVCNYCRNYKIRNLPKPLSELENVLESYRKQAGTEGIMPFSGGRDSSFALHLAVKELGLKVIAYTYDWGMVTDLGRRNISRMCAELGVENIVIAADIEKKRKYIRHNLKAWLSSPHLGMVSLLTAGDKHFYKYVERVKHQNDVSLNLWGVNPLETTHFKAGFLGVPPDFAGSKVYRSGLQAQLEYHRLRFGQMVRNPKYFNSSIFDTLSGEYHRSIAPKTDYFHLFDYWKWDENEINSTLVNDYGWELANDTSTTWRIGDGTAAFYNYVYFTVAGFSEHDTFRSNQIREGDISRDAALELVADENQPRYENIKWYLDAVGIDFKSAIQKVNAIPKLWRP